MTVNRKRIMCATALVLVAAAACADETNDAPSTTPSALDASSPDARKPPDDAEDLTCEATDAAGGVPAAYAGATNPLASDAAVAAGRATFAVRCAFCHGAKGEGDGPEGPRTPPPANLTAARRPDDYLLWRISTGGREVPFCSAMPSYERILDERERWEVVAFLQTIAPTLDDGGADAGDAGDP